MADQVVPVSKATIEKIRDDINQWLLDYNSDMDGIITARNASFCIDLTTLEDILLNRIDGIGIVR